ncbi:hypothetical protein IT418_03220 [bacterium]|nr:hypothetical protein [bacterium]
MRQSNPERKNYVPTGLPRTGIVVTSADGRLVNSNVLTPEISEGLKRNPPFDIENPTNKRTIAQTATTAFAAYAANENGINFDEANKLFAAISDIARRAPRLTDRIAKQYDMLDGLGVDLPYLMEPTGPNRKSQKMSKARYIEIVGATTILATLRRGVEDLDEKENNHLRTVINKAIAMDGQKKNDTMEKLDIIFIRIYQSSKTLVTGISNPFEFTSGLCARALAPNDFEKNYLAIENVSFQQNHERGNKDAKLEKENVTIATEVPIVTRVGDQKNPGHQAPGNKQEKNQKLEKKLGGVIYESKARRETNYTILKTIYLIGETVTDVGLVFANLQTFWYLNKLAQRTNRVLMDQEKKGPLNSISNLTRKLSITGAVYEYCNTKFQAERDGIRNGKTNGFKLWISLGATNLALGLIDSHFSKGLSIDDLFTVGIGNRRFGLTQGYYKLRSISPEEANEKAWADLETAAGTVRDFLDRFDDVFTVADIVAAFADQIIPDAIANNWFGSSVLQLLNDFLKKSSAGAEDISDLAEIPEVLAGLLEVYASMVNDEIKGKGTLTGSQYQLLREALKRYTERNNTDNDHLRTAANRILKKFGLPPIPTEEQEIVDNLRKAKQQISETLQNYVDDMSASEA